MTTLALMALTLQLGAEYHPYRTAEAAGTIYAVLVGPTAKPGLEEKLLSIVQEPAVVVARLAVFETRQMAVYGSTGVGDDALYGNWAVLRKRVQTPCLQVLEVIKVGPNVSSRHVDAACHISERILLGKDPRLFEVSGTRYEILSFLLRPPPEAWPARGPSADWYVTTAGKVDVESARLAFSYVRELISAPNVLVALRRDPWFLTQSEFPVFYPFDLRDPPKESEYVALPEAICVDLGSPAGARPRSCWMALPYSGRGP